MLTIHSARLMRRETYGIGIGNAADLLVFDCTDARAAVAELVPPLFGLKQGRLSFTRPPAQLEHGQIPFGLDRISSWLSTPIAN
jgi:cytosine deaminase